MSASTPNGYKKQTASGGRKKRSGIGPLLQLCEARWCRMPPHESHKLCANCLNEHRQIEKLMQEIRRTFPATQSMTTLQVIQRLWEFRWQRRTER